MKFIKKILGKSDTQKKPNATSGSQKKPVKILTSFDIAEALNVDRRKLEKSFVTLGWIEKTGRGIVATQEGTKNGAETKYNDMSRNNYVMWSEHILENDTLKASLGTL